MSKKTILYLGIPLEYTLTRKPVKNLNVHINEEGEILVSARNGISVEAINTFVESKAEWIIRNLADIERHNQVKPDNEVYIGKRVYFLGESCVIDIKYATKEQIVKEDNSIIIYTKNIENADAIKGKYIRWLYAQAQIVFKESMDRMYLIAQKEGVPEASLAVRNMKTRWGTCNLRTKKITLNLQLVKTSTQCIDQVVLHEFMHFKFPNHSADFYGLLDKYMSDWREYKKELEENFRDGI